MLFVWGFSIKSASLEESFKKPKKTKTFLNPIFYNYWQYFFSFLSFFLSFFFGPCWLLLLLVGIVGAKFNRLFLGKCITDKEAVRKVSNQWDVMSPSKPASTGESSVAAAKVAPGPRRLQGPMKIVIMGHIDCVCSPSNQLCNDNI